MTSEITSEAKTENTPQKSEIVRPSVRAAYSDLFEKLQSLVFLLDHDSFAILDANPAAESALNQTIEQLSGHPITEWIDPFDLVQFEKMLRVSRRRYYPNKFETLWKAPDNSTRIMKITACTMKLDENTSVLQIVADDITKEKDTETRAATLMKELQEANLKLEALSTTDEMTQLSNFRHFKIQIDAEHQRSSRYRSPYSLIFIDVDHFKKYNDTKGHAAGDMVLKEVAKIMKACVRETDFPARYGGEEFVILCPQTLSEGALILAERVRQKIETNNYPRELLLPDQKITISLGISSYPNDCETPDQLIIKADQALYHSKHNGRNRCTLYYKIKDLPASEEKK